MAVTCLGGTESENSDKNTMASMEDGSINNNSSPPGTPGREEKKTQNMQEEDDSTRMDVKGEITPKTMAKANKMLDQEDTPAKEEGGGTSNSDKTRNVSVGITSLTDKLKLLAKNSVALPNVAIPKII
jgi:hypothetical protein